MSKALDILKKFAIEATDEEFNAALAQSSARDHELLKILRRAKDDPAFGAHLEHQLEQATPERLTKKGRRKNWRKK